MNNTQQIDLKFMQLALELASTAKDKDEVPVGAVVVLDQKVIGEGHNRTLADRDPSAHAEIIALRSAAQALENHRLPDASIYITLEPCAMCAGAILQARLSRVVFGAHDPKSGAAGSVVDILQNEKFNHRCEVQGGILSDECGRMLQKFFASKRS